MKASASLMRGITVGTTLFLSSKYLVVRHVSDFVIATALVTGMITSCFHVYAAGTTHEPDLW
jgi:hypothetical protein